MRSIHEKSDGSRNVSFVLREQFNLLTNDSKTNLTVPAPTIPNNAWLAVSTICSECPHLVAGGDYLIGGHYDSSTTPVTWKLRNSNGVEDGLVSPWIPKFEKKRGLKKWIDDANKKRNCMLPS